MVIVVAVSASSVSDGEEEDNDKGIVLSSIRQASLFTSAAAEDDDIPSLSSSHATYNLWLARLVSNIPIAAFICEGG